MKESTKVITSRFINTVCTRLAENKRVRRSLPEWGRVHIDRQLPFLCIYRRLTEHDSALSERLIMGEASYVLASGSRRQHKQLSLLIQNIVKTLIESFGSFLIIEVWITPEEEAAIELPPYRPAFKIIRAKKTAIHSTSETLASALGRIKVRRQSAVVSIQADTKLSPPGLSPILLPDEAKQMGCHIIGIEVRPIYRNIDTKQIFPLIRSELQRGFARALKNSFFEFTHKHTPYRPAHYHSLGRLSMVKAVWEVDRQLADIGNNFDFLLQVTPTNSHAAWSTFERKHFATEPDFIYRPLPLDPAHAKRLLYKVPIERIEDPGLAQLFREQQLELDRKFTMLIDRGTMRFMYGSLQLYGPVESALIKLAAGLLEKLPPRSRDGSHGISVDVKTFAARAMQELDHFRKISPEIESKVLINDEINGLMVSQGNLLIGTHTKISDARIEALIQHEVGTHILTYINGKAQPFRQLYVGLAGYEELQEGLAVLSEYMVDGLTRPRMRLLAARVLAASDMVNGATFVEVFRMLNKTQGFERRTAFNITMRTFRSGGLTKDIVYLRGLVKLLEYLRTGGELEPLFVGKISVDHVAIINELKLRKVLRPALLRPRYFDKPQTVDKLKYLRNGATILKLITRS